MADEPKLSPEGKPATPSSVTQSAGAGPDSPKQGSNSAVPDGPPDPIPPVDLTVPSFIIALQRVLPNAVEQVSYWVGDWTLIVSFDRLLEVGSFLKDSPEAGFDFCSDVTVSDWPSRSQRFDVVYCLYSIQYRHRIRLKVRAADGDPVPSVTGLWPAANWLEREAFDMFGVNFTGHPDMRRILMPSEWQGHPQRKDYPLEGPGELLLESPMDWLRFRNMTDELEIE